MLWGMSNRDSIRDDRPQGRLYAMDSDQARYHCEKLRALADLLLSGVPVLWVERGSEAREQLSITIDRQRLVEAHISVRRRIAAGDPDYAIRIEPKPKSRGARRSWMSR